MFVANNWQWGGWNGRKPEVPSEGEIALVGPVMGVTGVLVAKAKIDTFQITLGVFQVVAMVMAGWLLWNQN